MEIQLINGIFSAAEAETLLRSIFESKIRFHQNRIKTKEDNEEDIEHSERRIMQLQQDLHNAVMMLRKSGETHTSLNANIALDSAFNPAV